MILKFVEKEKNIKLDKEKAETYKKNLEKAEKIYKELKKQKCNPKRNKKFDQKLISSKNIKISACTTLWLLTSGFASTHVVVSLRHPITY